MEGQITILGCRVTLSKSKKGFWVINYNINNTPIIGHVLSILLDGRKASISSVTDSEKGPMAALHTDFTNKRELLQTLRRPISVADIS